MTLQFVLLPATMQICQALISGKMSREDGKGEWLRMMGEATRMAAAAC